MIKKQYSADEKRKYFAKHREEIEKALIDGVAHCYTKDNFKCYLDTMAKFHSYSVNNCMLIAMQMPTATFVAGYTDWKKKFKRYVKEGEKGIRILRPNPFKVKAKEITDDEDDSGNEVVFNRYKMVSVFDVSQTDGKPLPQICRIVDKDVDDYDLLMDKLVSIAPVPVEFEKIDGGAHGYYSKTENRIVVCENMPQAQTVKTLVHEIAHSILHSDEFCDTPRNVKEIQAESVAYIVCSQLGIDTSEYSFEYVAVWAKEDRKRLAEQMSVVRKTADMILSNV